MRALSQHVYVPLLACHERQQRGRLAQVAKEQGGVIVALDGLAPIVSGTILAEEASGDRDIR